MLNGMPRRPSRAELHGTTSYKPAHPRDLMTTAPSMTLSQYRNVFPGGCNSSLSKNAGYFRIFKTGEIFKRSMVIKCVGRQFSCALILLLWPHGVILGVIRPQMHFSQLQQSPAPAISTSRPPGAVLTSHTRPCANCSTVRSQTVTLATCLPDGDGAGRPIHSPLQPGRRPLSLSVTDL